MARGFGTFNSSLQGLRIRVADINQFTPIGMLLYRAQVVLGDAAASNKRKADFAISDRNNIVAEHVRP
ncbi:MAG: hypothetical protein RID01_01690 [Algiphilus sp.]